MTELYRQLTRYYSDHRMWAGLTRHGLDEDEYRWSDGTLVDFFYWSNGEPNDHMDQESCVTFFPDNGILLMVEVVNSLSLCQFICRGKRIECN